jgi:hypothetical protein
MIYDTCENLNKTPHFNLVAGISRVLSTEACLLLHNEQLQASREKQSPWIFVGRGVVTLGAEEGAVAIAEGVAAAAPLVVEDALVVPEAVRDVR